MALHFTVEEFAGRRQRAVEALAAQDLDGLLIFRQESMYYLTGHPIGGVFDAYAGVCDAAEMQAHRLNATGYSLGALFAPNWMDWPMLYHGKPLL